MALRIYPLDNKKKKKIRVVVWHGAINFIFYFIDSNHEFEWNEGNKLSGTSAYGRTRSVKK